MDLARWLKAFIFLFSSLIKSLDLKAQASRSRFDGSGQVPERLQLFLFNSFLKSLELQSQASRSKFEQAGLEAESLHFPVQFLIQKLGFGFSDLSVHICGIWSGG